MQGIETQFEPNMILTKRVMQFAGNPPLLIISYFKQSLAA